MGDTKVYHEHLRGVGCDVQSCKYNAEGKHCSANGIKVQSEDATQKVETFCGTFAPKSTM